MINYLVTSRKGTCTLCGKTGQVLPIYRGAKKPNCKKHPDIPPSNSGSSGCEVCDTWFYNQFGV